MTTAQMTTEADREQRASAAGRWLHNPATGEIAHILRAAENGRLIEADLWLQPGAALARAHVHDHFIERFEVREGEVGFLLDGRERIVRAGDPAVEVGAGTEHDWWNSGDGIALVRAEVETAAPDGPPVTRFIATIEALWSLGARGEVNDEGVPDPLWLAAISREFRDAIRFTKPPAFVQTLLLGPLAAVARRTGRNPLAAELHGTAGACALPDPGADGLAKLLSRRVDTRESRGKG